MHGHPTALAHEEEKTIMNHVIKLSEFGFPADSFEVRCIMKAYLHRCGRPVRAFATNLSDTEWVIASLNVFKQLLLSSAYT